MKLKLKYVLIRTQKIIDIFRYKNGKSELILHSVIYIFVLNQIIFVLNWNEINFRSNQQGQVLHSSGHRWCQHRLVSFSKSSQVRVKFESSSSQVWVKFESSSSQVWVKFESSFN